MQAAALGRQKHWNKLQASLVFIVRCRPGQPGTHIHTLPPLLSSPHPISLSTESRYLLKPFPTQSKLHLPSLSKSTQPLCMLHSARRWWVWLHKSRKERLHAHLFACCSPTPLSGWDGVGSTRAAAGHKGIASCLNMQLWSHLHSQTDLALALSLGRMWSSFLF